MTKPTEYTLDVSKWRCGQDGEYALGEGDTKMLNDEGYMCCLGQFAEQVGVPESALNAAAVPGMVQRNLKRARIDDYYDDNFLITAPWSSHTSSDLAVVLMGFNDSEHTTPNEKIALITSKLAEHNIKLNVLDPNNQLDAFK